MPGTPTFVRVNDTVFGWESFSFKIDGFPIGGIVGISYSDKLERKKVYANRRDGRAVGRTAPKYSADASFKILQEDDDALTSYLSIKGLSSVGDARFQFIASYSEPEIGATPIVVVGSGCRIEEPKESYDEGVDQNVVEYTLSVMTLSKNGKQLWSKVRGIGQPSPPY